MSSVALVGDRVQGTDVASQAIAAEVSITATTSATGNVAMTAAGLFLGGTYNVFFFSPYITKGTTNIDVELFVDGVFSQTISGHLAASVGAPGMNWAGQVSLAPGAHSLTVRAFVDAGTGKVGANNGATGNPPNAVLRVVHA